VTMSSKLKSVSLVIEDRLLVKSVLKDTDLGDPVLEVDVKVSKPSIACLGSRMPRALEETAFELALSSAVKAFRA
jgi:hypothetical protein